MTDVQSSLIEFRPRIGQEVRTMHRYGFRSGEWAAIKEVALDVEGPLFYVEFADGTTDWWVATDPDGQYEFREAQRV